MAHPLLLLHPGLDRPPTAKEIGAEIRKMYGSRGVFASTRREGYFASFVASLCDQDDQYAANIFDGAQGEREWAERDQTLTGFSFSAREPEAHEIALASAKRGQVESLRLTVWFDAGSWPYYIPRYRFFRRSPRLGPRYRPTAPEVSIEDLRSLLCV